MPNSPSAKKRLKSDRKRRLRNRVRKSRVRSSEKQLLACLAAGDADGAAQVFRKCCAELDRAAKARTIHASQAARKKSRLASKLAAASPAPAE